MNSYLPNHERGSTMSDRIDHAAEAVALLNLAAATQHQGDPRHLIAASQVHATLALVEQQRIANLAALASLAGRDEDVHEEVAAAAYGALNAMIRYQDVPNGHAGPDEVAALRPDIAAALGIKAVDHD